MSNWMLIALVVLVVASIVLVLYRNNRNTETSRSQDERHARAPHGPDYAKDREDSRLAHMSADDRSWETASLMRNQANQARSATPLE